MHWRERLLLISAVVLTTLATTGAAHAHLTMTDLDANAMAEKEQTAILDPLRAVAKAAGAVGRAQGSRIFAGIQIDAPSRTVSIYLTDLKQQEAFLAAMRATGEAADLSPARFKQGAHTLTELKAAVGKLVMRGTTW